MKMWKTMYYIYRVKQTAPYSIRYAACESLGSATARFSRRGGIFRRFPDTPLSSQHIFSDFRIGRLFSTSLFVDAKVDVVVYRTPKRHKLLKTYYNIIFPSTRADASIFFIYHNISSIVNK